MIRALRLLVWSAWVGVRALLALATATHYVVGDDNDDIRAAWEAMHDDTQPIPVIR